MTDGDARVPVEVTVRDNSEESRYEAVAGDELAGIAVYEPRDGALVITHTLVLPGWEGRGVGGRLARGALDDARARGVAVVPVCPYIAAWIRRHPEYAELVPEGERHRLERPALG